jgi:hypothetical protein
LDLQQQIHIEALSPDNFNGKPDNDS